MRAVLIPRFGGPEVLTPAQVDIPRCGPDDILLRVAACGIDRKDLLIRNGTIRRKSWAYRAAAMSERADVELPLITGAEIAGTAVEVGANIRKFKAGDRLACLPRRGHCGVCIHCRTGRWESCEDFVFIGHDVNGGYAQYLLVGADSAWKVPDGVDLVAASLGAACVGTVVRAVRDIGQVKMGESVLVTGASGGLGVHAVQLAHIAGALVIAIASDEAKAARLRSLGADEVIVARHGEDWSETVVKRTGGRGVDVAIDIVGAATMRAVLRSMALYGRVIVVGEVGSGAIELRPAIVLLRRLSILASYSPGAEHLATALDLMARKQIVPVIDSSVPLAEATAAHARMERGEAFGRIVLIPPDDR